MRKITKIVGAVAVVLVAAAAAVFFVRVNVPPLRVALLYQGAPVENTAQFFLQPMLYHMEFEMVQSGQSLQGFDLVIVDASVQDAGAVRGFLEQGGRVAVTGRAHELFREIFPDKVLLPFAAEDGVLAVPGHTGVLQIFADYMHLFRGFEYYERLRTHQNGWAIQTVPTANMWPIVLTENGQETLVAELALPTAGGWAGEGRLYFLGGLLPCTLFTTSFDMQPQAGALPWFNFTAAAAEHLLWTELVEMVAVQERGFALRRVFGPHGRPGMAHQNHFEILSTLGAGGMTTWAEIAEEAGQIASFSLIYGWFEHFYRYESFGFALGDGAGGFINSRTDDFYAWGTHIVNADTGRWLNLAQYEGLYSFFQQPASPMRSFPMVMDFNNDGVPDLVSGSSDGYFHLFMGVTAPSETQRWEVRSAGKLVGADGEPLNVGGFSAPAIIRQDAYTLLTEPEIELRRTPIAFEDWVTSLFVSGSESGALYFFRQGELLRRVEPPVSMAFSAPGALYFFRQGELLRRVEPPVGMTFSAPGAFRDSHTILVGFADGSVWLYDYEHDYWFHIVDTGERYIAPTPTGEWSFIAGTADGDILEFHSNGWEEFYVRGEPFGGVTHVNHKARAGINTGNNVTPALVDINGDGIPDLVWGLLEYGTFAVAMSDSAFPYREILEAELARLEQMHVPVNLHAFTHIAALREDERAMLQAEISAMEALGIPMPMGTNQHTWQVSWLSPRQTLELQTELGFLWNFGFRPANAPVNPTYRTEYALVSPFFFEHNGAQMLLTTAAFMYDWPTMFAGNMRHGLPITIYAQVGPRAVNDHDALRDFAERVGAAQLYGMYNFMCETGLARSIYAAAATEVRVTRRIGDMALDLARRIIGVAPVYEMRIELLTPAEEWRESPLYCSLFAGSVGVRLTTGGSARLYAETDAPAWHRDGRALYMSLANGRTNIRTIHVPEAPNFQIHAINAPARITENSGEITIEFLTPGLQQVILRRGDELERITHTGDRITKVVGRDHR